MNTRALLLTTALACTALVGAAHANDSTSAQAVPYQYGMALKVAKVVSLTEPSTVKCEVVSAHMKYIDTAGKPAQISYRKLSEACGLQN